MQKSAQDPKREQSVQKVKYLIEKLKAITIVVEIIPFIYTALYIIVYAFSFHPNDDFLWLLDTLFYISPVVIVFLLMESHALKLCKWHKTACVLPIVPQIPIFINKYAFELSNYVIYIYLCCLIVMSVLLLVAAYKVFFCK